MAETDHQQIDTEAEAQASGTTFVELWLKKIKAAEKDEHDWHEDAEEAVKIYEADRDKNTSFNLYHSNVETLVPALYNTTPVPDVRRRFGDKDPIAKMGSDIIERAVSYCVDQYAFDDVMVSAVRAAATAGRGTARVRYLPQATETGVGYQEVLTEIVGWDRWGRGPALFWEDVPFIWFKHELTKDDIASLVGGDEEALKRAAEYTSEKDDDDSKDGKGILKTVCVYEIWDKASRNVIFITPQDKEKPLSVQDDPLGLPGFFPMPQPLQIAHRVKSLVPLCPFKIYQPLLEELDNITKRISKLVSQLRVRGLVDANLTQDFELLKNCDDGEYIAAKDVSQFATGSGGLEKAIAHWPMAETVAALQQLYLQRDQIKATIYEVTGIADILRGSSNPNETATAQNIKQEWGSLRIKDMQGAVARFARDLFRLKASIISRHFTPQNIMLMTSLPGEQQGQDPEKAQAEMMKFQQALQLLQQDSRSYRIDIESDSTVRADLGRKQEQMNQFLQGTAQFSSAISGLIQGAPQIAQPALPVMVEVFSQFARHFKLGKQAEDALESLGEQAQQASQQPPKEDPAAKQAEADMQMQQQKAQLEAQGMQMKAQHEERMAQLAEQEAAMGLQIKQMELQIKQAELELKRQSLAMDMQAKAMDMQMKREGAVLDREHAAESNAIKLDGMRQQQAAKQRPEARP